VVEGIFFVEIQVIPAQNELVEIETEKSGGDPACVHQSPIRASFSGTHGSRGMSLKCRRSEDLHLGYSYRLRREVLQHVNVSSSTVLLLVFLGFVWYPGPNQLTNHVHGNEA